MKILNLALENCYGIKQLNTELNFTSCRAVSIYACNGCMKSSLAQTFDDISKDVLSQDRIFRNRQTSRRITDESGIEIDKDEVVVIRPYDEVFSHTKKTSTLLINSELRKEYEQLHLKIDKAKNVLLQALVNVSGSKKTIENEISRTFTSSEDEFYTALLRIKDEVLAQADAPFEKVPYDQIFDEKVLSFLNTENFKITIKDYIEKYDELLAASTYFKKGIFNYYNADTIAKSLKNNGFFDANHTVSFNADQKVEITTLDELTGLIEEEKKSITNDNVLRQKFSKIEKQLNKNSNLRGFHEYLLENKDLLPHFSNIDKFREEVLKSYLKVKKDRVHPSNAISI